MEAVFWWRIRLPDLAGSAKTQRETVETGGRIQLSNSCTQFLAFSRWFQPEMGSFLRTFPGNSLNTASEIIVLGTSGKKIGFLRCTVNAKQTNMRWGTKSVAHAHMSM